MDSETGDTDTGDIIGGTGTGDGIGGSNTRHTTVAYTLWKASRGRTVTNDKKSKQKFGVEANQKPMSA